MTDIVINTPVAAIGGVALKAAGLIATTTAHTGVLLDNGPFAVQIDWTACEVATGDELYIIAVEANTVAAPTVWTQIGIMYVLGGTAKVASMGDATATGSARAAFHNSKGYQVRLKTWVSGTVATGINYAAKAYPIKDLSVIG